MVRSFSWPGPTSSAVSPLCGESVRLKRPMRHKSPGRRFSGPRLWPRGSGRSLPAAISQLMRPRVRRWKGPVGKGGRAIRERTPPEAWNHAFAVGQSGIAATKYSDGCPPGIRTPICCSRGSCPTIERGGNAANKKPADSPGLSIVKAQTNSGQCDQSLATLKLPINVQIGTFIEDWIR